MNGNSAFEHFDQFEIVADFRLEESLNECDLSGDWVKGFQVPTDLPSHRPNPWYLVSDGDTRTTPGKDARHGPGLCEGFLGVAPRHR